MPLHEHARNTIVQCGDDTDNHPWRRGVYIVPNAKNGVRLPEKALDFIGIPGIVVKGRVLEADGLKALAVEGQEP